MDIDEVLLETEDSMDKSVGDYESHLKGVRSGQASVEMLDNIYVDVPSYGGSSPLKQVGLIQKADARMLTVKPFDAKIIKDIEKALQAANMGVTVGNDGKIIRVTFPPLSEETRKKQTKVIKERLEQHKITIRKYRHEALDNLKKLEKEGTSEDAVKKAQEDVNELTKSHEAQLEALYERKAKEIMTV